jgi:hypothetical protein
MNLTELIVKAFLVMFGTFEVISNIYHLTRGSMSDIADSAKRQHGELPKHLSDRHFAIKAAIMFFLGLLFLSSGLYMYIIQGFIPWIAVFPLVILCLYGLVQAFIYRKYWSALASGIVYSLPLILYLIFGSN